MSDSADRVGHLVVVQATRADALADDLAARMRESARDSANPLDECIVVLQGAGMSNWLRREMAHRLGAWGGVKTPFLRKFLFDMTARCVGAPVSRASRDDIRELAYMIAAHVARLDASASGREGASGTSRARIVPFLAACRDSAGNLSIDALLTHSHALAESFDRYEVDRPDMIAAWESRDSAWRDLECSGGRWSQAAIDAESWQRALWREVVPGKWRSHGVWTQFFALINQLNADGATTPASLESIRLISVFGVSTLPKSVVAFLEALARHVPVAVHMLVATEAVPEHARTDRAIANLAVRQGTDSATTRDRLKHDQRNALCTTLGIAAVEMAQVLDSFEHIEVNLCEVAPSDSQTLLGAMQQAVREDLPSSEVSASVDGSVQFHSVSSASRAGEVAYDEILRAFVEWPDLAQEEVAILVPSLPNYASAIEAVFARRAAERPGRTNLAINIADPSARDQSPLAVALNQMMALATEDASFAQVCALLTSPPVCDAMGASVADVRRQLELIADAGACRFFDREHRQRWLGTRGDDDDSLHTLDWAMSRVVMGTLTGDSESSKVAIDSVLPSGSVTGTHIELFFQIASRIDVLREFAASAAANAQTFGVWEAKLHALVDCILPDASHATWGEARARADQALHRVARAATSAELPAVEFAVARREFNAALESVTEGAWFARGAVTLARLAPMRSVPFRVIALVGLDRGVFPRAIRTDPMDIETLAPRAGDRNAHNDDLLVLLESINAVQDRLIVISEGIEASTTRVKPTSAVVDLLIEECAGHLGVSTPHAREQLGRTHGPMADQPEAWLPGAPVGFDAAARARAQVIAAARTQATRRVFVDAGGATQLPRGEFASIRELSAAVRSPVKSFLRASGMQCGSMNDPLDASAEPIEFDHREDALDIVTLRRRAIELALCGGDRASVRESLRLDGQLPHGASGSSLWLKLAALTEGVRGAVEDVCREKGGSLPVGWKCVDALFEVACIEQPLSFESLQIDGLGTQLLTRRKDKSADAIDGWLQHLAWCAMGGDARAVRVTLEIKDSSAEAEWLDPIDPDRARDVLREVLLWARVAVSELTPFDGRLLKPWLGGKTQRKEPPSLGSVRAEFEQIVGYDRELELAFRGVEFFEYRSRSEKSQSFEEIAAWLSRLMQETGWGA